MNLMNSIFTLSFNNYTSIHYTRYDLSERSEFRRCVLLTSEGSEYTPSYVYNITSDVMSVRVKKGLKEKAEEYNIHLGDRVS